MNMLRGFDRMFADGRLALGLFVPIEAYRGSMPTMRDHPALAQRAEQPDFAAVWVRDVPLLDPAFGNVGQIYNSWIYFGYLAAATRRVALASGSIMLPLFPAETQPTPAQEPTAREATPNPSPVGESLVESADAVRARI